MQKSRRMVFGKPEKTLVIMSDLAGEVEFSKDDLAIFHALDGNKFALEVVANAWVPRKIIANSIRWLNGRSAPAGTWLDFESPMLNAGG